jgi:hypothetical protein
VAKVPAAKIEAAVAMMVRLVMMCSLKMSHRKSMRQYDPAPGLRARANHRSAPRLKLY